MNLQPLEPLQALKQTAFFSAFPPETLVALQQGSALADFADGQMIFGEDETANAVYLLLEGKARLMKSQPDGSQQMLRLFLPGQLIGAMGVMREDGRYPASAFAVGQARLMEISAGVLQAEMASAAVPKLDMMRVMVGYLADMAQGHNQDPEVEIELRVARTLLGCAGQIGRKVGKGNELEVRISQAGLAERSDTNPFSVSRMLKRWATLGYIRLGRQRIVILDPHGIVRMAEGMPHYH